MKVEVFGTGCAKCKRLERNITEALAQVGIDAEVVKVEDIDAITGRGIMVTPALAVDGMLKFMGRVPSITELIDILKE
jgi:small redox-active disulfide protein 2